MSHPLFSKPAVPMLAAAVGAGFISSCALVLGFQDHEPYPAGSGGSSSSASSSTSSSSGGVGGSSSSSSSGSSSGAGGDGGCAPPTQFGNQTTIATLQVNPSYLTIDGTGTIYWANIATPGLQEIWSLANSSTTPFRVAYNQGDLRGLAVDAVNVWSAEGWQVNGQSDISYFPKASTTYHYPPFLLYWAGGWTTFRAIALQGTFLAWSSLESGGSVFRGDTMNTPKNPVATSQGAGVGSVAIDGLTTTYWVNGGTQGAVMKSVNGTVTTFATQDSPTSVAVDSDNVYWTANDGQVRILSKMSPGGQPTVIANDPTFLPQAITLDATNVYWAENPTETNMNGRVRTAWKCGAGWDVQTLAMGTSPFGVAVDGTAVYATMQGNGTTMQGDGGTMQGKGYIVKIPKL